MSDRAKDFAIQTKVRLQMDPSSRRLMVVMLTLGMMLVTTRMASGQSATASITTWGSNGNGQLGRPNPPGNLIPGFVLNLGAGSGVMTAAGSSHTLALKSDGTVLAWGANTNGQLGDGTTVSKLSPVQVSGLGAGSGVVAVAAGAAFSLALKSDGTVLAWGSNANGQLGDGTTTQRTTPVQVSGLGAASDVVSIAAGLGSHALALKADGSVLAWGSNSNGQLGDGTTTQRTTPVSVSGLGAGSGVVALAAGNTHSFARKMDGTVLAWGANSTGQLGDGTTVQRTAPVQVSTFGVGSGIISVAAGISHSLALKSDGTIWAWGFNGSGQLGDGTFNQRTTPGQVSDPSGIGFLTAGMAIAADGIYSVALQNDGTVLAWGANNSGQLGDGSSTMRVRPVVTGLTAGSGTVKIAAGDSHTLAVKNDGSLFSWGANTMGQLGKGTYDGGPLSIDSLTGIGMIAAGPAGSHSLALKTDGTVMAWGFNLNGQLGDGTTVSRNAPVQVSTLGPSSGVIAIVAGTSHSLALKSDGTVLAWGSNTNGQLGDSTTSTRTTPVRVTNLGPGSGIIAIAAGTSFSLALSSDGTVFAWGLNSSGQLGDGTFTQRTIPVRVSGLGTGSGVVAIAAGIAHGLALKSDNTVSGWGLNTNGQLGDGTFAQRSIPVQVHDVTGVGVLTGVTSIASGSSHSFALRSDGTVFTWGLNTTGQLGDGTAISRNLPVQAALLGTGSGIVKVVGGASHSMALKSNGDVWVWGSNASGQLGDGTLENHGLPVQSIVTNAQAIAAGSLHSMAFAAPPPPPVDITAPVVTFALAGTSGNNGWYRSDVTVTWTIVDPESSIASSSGCSPTTLSADTAGQTLTCTATNSAGLTGSASVTVKIDKTQPAVTFTRTAANMNGWNNGAVLVRFNATDATSGLDGVAMVERNITTEGQNQSASATFMDLAGNTVTAMVDAINIDLTAPTAQFGVPSPAANSAGWNNTDVQISFTTADNLSGVATSSPSSPLLLTTEGANIKASVTVTDLAGNSASFDSPAVQIDRTAPVATATASPLPTAQGWNKTDVTVTFTQTDSLSGIGSCSAAVILSSDGTNQSASGTCTDKAGNVSSPATVSGINIDKTAPVVQFGAASPAANAAGWNKTNVQISFTTTDNLSGVATVSPSSPLALIIEGTNIRGSVTVTDIAGNSVTLNSAAVQIDKTPPSATATASPLPNSQGWNNTDVTVTFVGTDSTSGIAGCSPAVTLSTNGSNQSASGSCTDKAGNVSAPATVSGININKTQPSLSGLPGADCIIWPPDRRLVQVAAINANDSSFVPGSLSINVTSNEPLNPSDVEVSDGVVKVRADRLGNGKGRIYTVTARASTVSGSAVVATGKCSVPHDMSH